MQDEPTRIVGRAPQEEPTRIMGSTPKAEPEEDATRVIPTRPAVSSAPEVEQAASFAPPLDREPEADSTRILDASTRAAFPGSSRKAVDENEGTRVIPSTRPEAVREPEPEDEDARWKMPATAWQKRSFAGSRRSRPSSAPGSRCGDSCTINS